MSRTAPVGLVITTSVVFLLIIFPASFAGARAPLEGVAQVSIPPLDLNAVAAEDAQRQSQGLPPRFAVPTETWISPATDGTWEDLDAATRLWRVRISSPGAVSLNLGFTAYFMPPHAMLSIYGTYTSETLQPFTAQDNAAHGELWTPIILTDDIIVEVTVARDEAAQVVLELTSINVGYRHFAELVTTGERAGSCNIDVICSQADAWRNEIPAVGVISTGGSTFCTGFMVNNTAQNQVPYFMTANHCGINSGNAASLVVYWNFYSPTCGQHGGGSLSQNQTGSFFRASYSTSDFTLVELDSLPNAAWGITYAGWERGTGDPSSTVCIHHPNTDEKSISFDYQPAPTTSYLGSSSPGDGTHLKVDWDLGVTEPGSSGSPLFDQNHRVVGQLHGGYSACGASDMRDWYGRLSRSWTGGGTNSSRLSNWLDPGSTGAANVDTYNPQATGLSVTPSDGLSAQGDPGGPFTPSNKVYTLRNQGASSFNYTVSNTQNWVTLTNASGTLAASATVNVTVSINANANALATGTYSDTINFINTTTHSGDTSRPVSLQVGVPSLAYSFNMNTNPGWTTTGLWAYGDPTGSGGQYGEPDPNNGHTGTNVYGYNLSGDYENNLPERHLTTTAINCSNLTAVSLTFWRWLGVERSLYDHAYVRVSNDNVNWTTLWQNGVEVADTSWSQQSFDISSVADNRPTVYIRWTMGTTDGSWQYCGWNIDDVEIWGINAAPCTSANITAQPQSQTRCVGQSVTFTVTAGGTAPLAYQWRKGGNNIGGATSSAYTIASVGAGDAANYDCVVTNGCGSATSNAATLTVNTSPSITGQPQNQTRCVGQSVTFTVTAGGTAPLTYQWRKGGNNIGGATSSAYTIASLVTGDAANYDCVVTNGCGSATSNAATLTVNTAASFTLMPADELVSVGDSVSFTVSAAGTPPLTYQWYLDGAPLSDGAGVSGATTAMLTISPVEAADAGMYDAVVANACGPTGSDPGMLRVRGDFDVDGDVDVLDYAAFHDCFGGPDAAPVPTLPATSQQCRDMLDFDFDLDVDLQDFAEFEVIFSVP